jgi:hypothetical protein
VTRNLLRACRYMGWSWADLMATPGEVVEEVFGLMSEEGRA